MGHDRDLDLVEVVLVLYLDVEVTGHDRVRFVGDGNVHVLGDTEGGVVHDQR